MDNVTFTELTTANGELVEYAIIDRGNGEFTSMPKSEYDRIQAELKKIKAPIVE
jgi:hypothetical protein